MEYPHCVQSLILYMIAMAITPGPNTLLSMANASECGLRRGIRLNFGMLAGISAVTVISFAASKALYAIIPSAELVLKAIGAAYLVYLAIRMILRKEGSRSGSGCTFLEGMLLQLINFKVYLLALTAISSYIIPMTESLLKQAMLASLIPIICFLSGLVWAVGGSLLSRLFCEHRRAMNGAFAAALLYCAIALFAE